MYDSSISQAVKAYVVPKPDVVLTADDVKAFVIGMWSLFTPHPTPTQSTTTTAATATTTATAASAAATTAIAATTATTAALAHMHTCSMSLYVALSFSFAHGGPCSLLPTLPIVCRRPLLCLYRAPWPMTLITCRPTKFSSVQFSSVQCNTP